MLTTSNVFDPIQETLDQRVFNGETPKPSVIQFIRRLFYREYYRRFSAKTPVSLYLTGSLTTFQYSDTSDADISVFPNYDFYPDPELFRKNLIKLSIQKLDGAILPGSTHPLQFFINPPGLTPASKFKPGERSGWSFDEEAWFVPPERDRAKDIQKELPELYARAADMARKMEDMLSHDPPAAKELFKQVHLKRMLDQQAGLGDFSEGNIVYKYLLKQGLFDRLRNELGMYITTKTIPHAAGMDVEFVARDEVDGVIVSTVDITAILGEYETLILGGQYDGEVWSAKTRYEAMNNHTRALHALEMGIDPNVVIGSPGGRWKRLDPNRRKAAIDFAVGPSGMLEPSWEGDSSVIIADMKDYTTFCEKVSPGFAQQITSDAVNRIKDIISSHGGSINGLGGDSVLVTFSMPGHAQAAVAAGIEVQKQFVTEVWRMGINTGPVSMGTQVIGDTVNTAQRLETLCAPGHILISEETFNRSHQTFPAHYVGTLDVKGKENPVKAYHVDIPGPRPLEK